MFWAYVGIWLYCSPIPAAWCFVFFTLRRQHPLGWSWAMASVLALVWLPYWAQLLVWEHFRGRRADSYERNVDRLEAELRSLPV